MFQFFNLQKYINIEKETFTVRIRRYASSLELLYFCKKRRHRRGRYGRGTGNWSSRTDIAAVSRDETLVEDWMGITIDVYQERRRHKMRSRLSLK